MKPEDSPIGSTDIVDKLEVSPGHQEIPMAARIAGEIISDKNKHLSWASGSDVGLVRSHNEDSFLLKAPLFAVCDGMGGHAAGEVASSIAVEAISAHAPQHAQDVLLGAAVEEANRTIIREIAAGTGAEGMGCTASAVMIEKNMLAAAHVGDSRIYVLSGGKLQKVTHDHSFVEELVEAGELTADEARLHPARSVITRALGSDPEMVADHFMLELATGDRVIICSDGLSGMVPDDIIEALSISSATPSQAVQALLSAALTSGGSDNVTVIVIDILNDGIADEQRIRFLKRVVLWISILVLAIFLCVGTAAFFINNEFYLGLEGEYVAIYQGLEGEFLGIPLSTLVYASDVDATELPEAVLHQLEEGISIDDYQSALEIIKAYRNQIQEQKSKEEETAEEILQESEDEDLEFVSVEDDSDAAAQDTQNTTTPGTVTSDDQEAGV